MRGCRSGRHPASTSARRCGWRSSLVRATPWSLYSRMAARGISRSCSTPSSCVRRTCRCRNGWLERTRPRADGNQRARGTPVGPGRYRSIKTRAPEGLQVMLALGFLRDRQFAGDMGEREVGLNAAQLLERGLGKIDLASHGRRGSEHPVGADEVETLTDGFSRQANSLIVVTSDELRIGGHGAEDRGERIARAESQSPSRGGGAFLPAPAV